MTKKNIIIISSIALILLSLWAWQAGWFSQKNVEPIVMPDGLVLFSGDGCPYCKIVDDYIADNGIYGKLKLTKLEIPFKGKTSAKLRANADLLTQAALKCKYDIRGGVPIPFLFDGKDSCFVGNIDIVNYFNDKISTQE